MAKKDDPVEELKGYLNSTSKRNNIFHINDLKYGQPTESDLKTMVAKLKLLQTSFDELSIPTPFKNSAEEVDIELKFVRMLRKLTENPDTIQDIEEEDRDLLSPFLRFTQAKHLPVDEAFLRLLIDDINAITMRFKYMFNRPRPKQLAAQKDLELVAHDGSSAHSPSYPSGHAVAGRVIARALSDKYPDFAEDFQRIGAAIGLNRLIAGLHYPTDHAAGVMLADQLYAKGLVKDHTNFMMPESEDIVRAVQAAVTKHAEGFNLNKSIDDIGILVDIFKASRWEGAFRGDLDFLSNYSPAKVGGWKWNKDTNEWESDGKTYPTTEHAYQAGKFDDDDIREVIRTAKTPGEAKRLGGRRGPYANKNIINARDGSENSPVLQLMEKLVTEKFNIPELRAKLVKTLETHPELEESNNWGDDFWGTVGGKGTNHLGKILTKVRGDTPKRHIYVFGSNLDGQNYGGAAKQAWEFGASRDGIEGGVEDRIEGDTYSLPTKISIFPEKFMTIEDMQPHLNAFAQFVADNPNMVFHLANLGMKMGGFSTPEKKEQLGEAFNNAFKAAGITRALDLKDRLHFDSEKGVDGVGLASVALGGNLPHDPTAFKMPKERWSGTPHHSMNPDPQTEPVKPKFEAASKFDYNEKTPARNEALAATGNTYNAILAGERTQTTRDKWRNAAEGDIVAFYPNTKGVDTIHVRITKVTPTSKMSPSEWSEKEGWHENQHATYTGAQFKSYEFEVIEDDNLTKARTTFESSPAGKNYFKISGKTPQVDVTDRKVTVHSGGAAGSDDEWAKAFPDEVIGHSFKGHSMVNRSGQNILEDSRLLSEENQGKYTDAYNWLVRNGDSGRRKVSNTYSKKLMGRNWEQVKDSDAVLGVIEKLNGNAPAGGTGVAIAMGMQKGIPVHVFNQETGNWLTWNPDSNAWDETSVDDIPHYKNFAGVGTRGEKQSDGSRILQDSGKAAIQAYAGKIKTFQKGTEPFFTPSSTTQPAVQTDAPPLPPLPKRDDYPGLGNLDKLNRSEAEEAELNEAMQAYSDDLDTHLDAIENTRTAGTFETPKEKATAEASRVKAATGWRKDYESEDPNAEYFVSPTIPEAQALSVGQDELQRELDTLRRTHEGKEDTEYIKTNPLVQTQIGILENAIERYGQARENRLSGTVEGTGTPEDETETGTDVTREGLGKPQSKFEEEQTKPYEVVESIKSNVEAAIKRSHQPTHYLLMNPTDFREYVGMNAYNFETGQWDNDIRKKPGVSVPGRRNFSNLSSKLEPKIQATLIDGKTGEAITGEALTEYLKQRNSPTYDADGSSMITIVRDVFPEDRDERIKFIEDRLRDEGVEIDSKEGGDTAHNNFKRLVELDQESPYTKNTMNTSSANISDAGGGWLNFSFTTGNKTQYIVQNAIAKLTALASGKSFLNRDEDLTPDYGEKPEAGMQEESQYVTEGASVKAGNLQNLIDILIDKTTTASGYADASNILNLIRDAYDEVFEPVFRIKDPTFMQGKEYREGTDDPKFKADLDAWLRSEIDPVVDEMLEQEEEARVKRIADFRETRSDIIDSLDDNKKENFENNIDNHSQSTEDLENHLMYSSLIGSFIPKDRDTGEPKVIMGNLSKWILDGREELREDLTKRYNETFQEPSMPEPIPPRMTVEEFDRQVQDDPDYGTDADRDDLVDAWNDPATAAWSKFNNKPPLKGLLAMVDRTLTNPKFFTEGEGGTRNYSGREILKRLFLHTSNHLSPSERWNQTARAIKAGNYDQETPLATGKTRRPNLYDYPVKMDDLSTFADVFNLTGMDSYFASGNRPNDLSRQGLNFFQERNHPEYTFLLSGLAERKRGLLKDIDEQYGSDEDRENKKPRVSVEKFIEDLERNPSVYEDDSLSKDAEERKLELRANWEEWDRIERAVKEAKDGVNEQLYKEFHARALDTEFRYTYGPNSGVLSELSGKVSNTDEEGIVEEQHIIPNDFKDMIADDFEGALKESTELVRDEGGEQVAVPLFTGKLTGEIPKITRNQPLRVFSSADQGIGRFLIQAEDDLVNTYFPNITLTQRFGENREGGGQGLQGLLEDLKEEFFGGPYKDTPEETTAPMTAEKFIPYLNALQDRLLEIRDRDNWNGEIFTVPVSTTEELPETTERYEEDQYREGRTKKDFPEGGTPRDFGEGVDIRREIDRPTRVNFSLGAPPPIDAEKLTGLPIRNVEAERDPDESFRSFEDELAGEIAPPFDPYKVITHETVEDGILEDTRKATVSKIPNVQKDPAQVDYSGAVGETAPRQVSSPSENTLQDPALQEELEAVKTRLSSEQGTENAL